MDTLICIFLGFKKIKRDMKAAQKMVWGHEYFEILGGKWCILLYSDPFVWPALCSMASQILAYTIDFLLLDMLSERSGSHIFLSFCFSLNWCVLLTVHFPA